MSEVLLVNFDGTSAGVYPIGDANSRAGISMNFLGKAYNLSKCAFWLQKHGTPTDTIYAKLYAMTGTYGSTGKPTGSALATSDAFSESNISAGFNEFTFSGANQYLLEDGVYYCLTIEDTSAGGDYIEASYLNGGYDGNSADYSTDTTSWSERSWDYRFKVYGNGIATTLTAEVGSFVLTGIDVTLKATAILIAEVGTFTLTFKDIVINRVNYWKDQAKNFMANIRNQPKS